MKKIRWWGWILIVIVGAIVGIGIYMYCYYILWMKMGSEMVKNAEAAVSSGITVSDPQNDFVMMGTNKEEVVSTDKNNPSPYVVDYLDIKSIHVGADDKYIYYKVIYYNTIPKWPESINNDVIVAIGNKLHIVNEKGEDLIVSHFDFGYEPVIKIGALNTSYDYCPTGIEWPEDARMACHNDNSKIYGGGGTDYIMGALPMDKVGLALDQTIYFTIDEETKSSQFTHAAVDVLGTNGKESQVIKWSIGSNKFEPVKLSQSKNN